MAGATQPAVEVLARFTRAPGELRVTLEREQRRVSVALYVVSGLGKHARFVKLSGVRFRADELLELLGSLERARDAFYGRPGEQGRLGL